MRKINFNELKLKEKYNENTFFEYYSKNLKKEIKEENNYKKPSKKYEIFYLNIFEGKIVLLNKEYINNNNLENQEIFYSYEIAYKIYNNLLDIYDGIEAEKNEFNELYIDERMKKNLEIEKLKKIDEEIFNNAIKEYQNLNQDKKYKENVEREEKNLNISNIKNNNISFLKKLINKIKEILKLSNGENK